MSDCPSENERQWVMFTLYLQNNSVVLGHSHINALDNTIASHIKGDFPTLTQLYKLERDPQFEYFDTQDQATDYEFYQTIRHIRRFGINKVRGHIYSSFLIPESDKHVLNSILSYNQPVCHKCGNGDCHGECLTANTEYEMCTRCKKYGHSALICHAVTDADGEELVSNHSYTDSDSSSECECENHSQQNEKLKYK